MEARGDTKMTQVYHPSSEAENATPRDHAAATGWKSSTSWFYEISFFEEILYIFKQK